MTGNVLILGGSGRFGRHAAEAFWNAGWRVRMFDRAGGMDLTEAALGMDVIVNGWNPAYPDWSRDVPRLTEQVIAAAQWTGATVLVPGNVYVYGDTAPADFGPDVPHGANNALGRIRRDMEEAYRAAGVQTIVLRAGDFIDTEASGNWFDKIIVPRVHSGRITYPGPLDAAHAWAYLPDMARAAVGLCEMRDTLPVFADIPYAGYTLSGAELAQALGVAVGRDVTAKRMAWWPIRMAGLVSPMMRALTEMRYLWRKPHRIDPRPMDRLLPGHVQTPLVAALTRAVPKAPQPRVKADAKAAAPVS